MQTRRAARQQAFVKVRGAYIAGGQASCRQAAKQVHRQATRQYNATLLHAVGRWAARQACRGGSQLGARQASVYARDCLQEADAANYPAKKTATAYAKVTDCCSLL